MSAAAASEKGRLVQLSYVHGDEFVHPLLVVYLDAAGTPNGEFNVYARRSFDGGATWDGPTLLSRCADDSPSGGREIDVREP